MQTARPVPKISTQIKKRKVKASTGPRVTVLSRAERLEMERLNSMLPPVARFSNPSMDPTTVLTDTCAYIDQLMATINARVNQGTLPRDILSKLAVPPVSPTSAPSQQVMKQKRSSRMEKRH